MASGARRLALTVGVLVGGLGLGLGACSTGSSPAPAGDRADPARELRAVAAPRTPNFVAGPVDTSRATVQRMPELQTARAFRSGRLADLVADEEVEDDVTVPEHPVMPKPPPSGPPELTPSPFDPVVQATNGKLNMPNPMVTFAGMGTTLSGFKVNADPPDTNGAVGPNHYVQTVNESITVFDKTGNVLFGPKPLKVLWTGYVGTNPGNACATSSGGDPIVMYDQLADRWFVSQLSYPNHGTKPPSYECIAVSESGDPTGAYFLYDYTYNVGLNDYPKFGVWPDAYYGSYNLFGAGVAGFCAFDRVSMLAGASAAQQCFTQASNVYGALPASVDGKVTPPRGSPGMFLELGEDKKRNFNNTLDLYTFAVDWQNPANTKVTGPVSMPVAPYVPACNGGTCVPQPSGDKLDSLADRLMYRLAYRNFGTHEALLVNHSVAAGTGGGVRWYELRSPWSAPTVYQQSTYAPGAVDAGASPYRWMASVAQDQAQGIAMGFSLSSTTQFPSVGWTGRLASDPLGVMAQGESDFDLGTGVEKGGIHRWGDYSSMNVDPVDDCTFWYTQMLYDVSGGSWATVVASAYAFPSCAANDFQIHLTPRYRSVAPGAKVSYSVTTSLAAGTAETIALNVQDLPAGVTGAFVPPTVSAGGSSVLTLTAASGATPTAAPITFMVIGTAPSAVHPVTADVVVGSCTPLTVCPAPDNCGSLDNCGAALVCGSAGGACVALDECHEAGACTANVCTNPPKPAGSPCSLGTCQGGVCTATGQDGGTDAPADAPKDAPTDAPKDAPQDAPRDAPQDAPRDAPKDAPQDARLEASSDAGCTPATSCPIGFTCGTTDDGCGGTLDCGSCAGGAACVSNVCASVAEAGAEAGPVDASGAVDSAVAEAGSTPDADTGDASDAGFSSLTGGGGGCGCRTAQARQGRLPPALVALGVLGLAVRLRRRRR